MPAAAEHRPRRPIAAPRQPAESADRRWLTVVRSSHRAGLTVAKYITCNQLQNFFRVGPSGACLSREEWALWILHSRGGPTGGAWSHFTYGGLELMTLCPSTSRSPRIAGRRDSHLTAVPRVCYRTGISDLERMPMMPDYAIQPCHGSRPLAHHSRRLAWRSGPLLREALSARAEGAARHFASTTATPTACLAGRARVQGGAGCRRCRTQDAELT